MFGKLLLSSILYSVIPFIVSDNVTIAHIPIQSPNNCTDGVTHEFGGQNGTIVGQKGYNLFCHYRITVEPEQKILVKFDYVALETSYDFLYVYDGNSSSAPLPRRFTGISHTIPPFLSTTNQLFLSYTTDHSASYDGFRLRYFAVDSNCKLSFIKNI